MKVDGKEVNASGSFRNFGEEDMPVYQKADGTMEYLMQIDSNEENGLAVKKIQVILENLGTVNKQAEFVPDVKGSWTGNLQARKKRKDCRSIRRSEIRIR